MSVWDRARRQAARWNRLTERVERRARIAWRRHNLPGVVIREGDRLALRFDDDVRRVRVAEVVETEHGLRLRLEPLPSSWPGWLAVLTDSMLAASLRKPGDLTGLGGWDVPPRRPGDPRDPGGAIGRPRPDGTAGLFQFMPPTQMSPPMEYARRFAGRPEGLEALERYAAGRVRYYREQLARRPAEPPTWLQETTEAVVRLYRPVLDALEAFVERLRSEQAATLGGLEASQVIVDEAQQMMRAQPIIDTGSALEPPASVISPSMQAVIDESVARQARETLKWRAMNRRGMAT